MKDFQVQFYAYHGKLRNKEAMMKMRGASLERILPRIKKVEAFLNKLPNPHSHSKWTVTRIDEL